MSQLTATESAGARRPRRADAQRNYDRVLEVARAAVAEHGGDIVLEDIARQAGVGIGTLYRHFPNRQALLEAVFLDDAEQLRRVGEEMCEDCDERAPLDLLVEWLRMQMVFGARGRSMGAAVMNAKHTEGSTIQVACLAARDAGAVLLQRAQEAGQVRQAVNISDVLALIHGIIVASDQAEDRAERVERMFDLLVAGLRP
ncbi:MAG: TetR/AcrR family transcriptional regulator [Acidimicrobiaceae bacterium]|nr:TetR/AcrR family transcriptional regulator [Acidimicrobiaceae bacterium]